MKKVKFYKAYLTTNFQAHYEEVEGYNMENGLMLGKASSDTCYKLYDLMSGMYAGKSFNTIKQAREFIASPVFIDYLEKVNTARKKDSYISRVLELSFYKQNRR